VTNEELKEAMLAVTDLLKTQAVYVRNLHEAQSALVDALLSLVPQLEETQRREMEKIRENPFQTGQLDALDELLQRMSQW
jgi:hypothetical protein